MKLTDCQKIAATYEDLAARASKALLVGDVETYLRLSDAATKIHPEAANAYWFKEHPGALPWFAKDPAWVPPSDLKLADYCGNCHIHQSLHPARCPEFLPFKR